MKNRRFSIKQRFGVVYYLKYFMFISVDSISEFKFFSEGENTKYVETVQYECPIFFTVLCYKEVMYQRQEIMKNLKSHFATANIKVNYDK